MESGQTKKHDDASDLWLMGQRKACLMV